MKKHTNEIEHDDPKGLTRTSASSITRYTASLVRRGLEALELSRGESFSVLIVDDVLDTRVNIKKIFYLDGQIISRRSFLQHSTDFTRQIVVVGEAGTGTEAIEVYKEVSPDLVLSNINMPEMDGIEMTREILNIDPDGQVLILTVVCSPRTVHLAIEAGAKGLICKPPASDVLCRAIRDIIKRRRNKSSGQYFFIPENDSKFEIHGEFHPNNTIRKFEGFEALPISSVISVRLDKHYQKNIKKVRIGDIDPHRITVLDLSEVNLSDDGVRYLAQCRNVRYISLCKRMISRKGIDLIHELELEKRMKIYWYG